MACRTNPRYGYVGDFRRGTILLWSGLVNPRDGWLVWMIALPLLVIEVAYLNLYKFPQRKRSDTPAGPDE